MRALRVIATMLVCGLVAAQTREVTATPIVYSLEFVASGRLGGRPFQNEPVVLTVFSDTEPVSIDDIPTNVENAIERLAQALVAGSYIAGFGFVIAALVKFRKHRQNSQQVEIQLGGTSGVADGTVVATLSAGALRSSALGGPIQRIVTAVSFAPPLELPLLRDDKVKTLRIDSIRGNRAELRARVIGAPP